MKISASYLFEAYRFHQGGECNLSREIDVARVWQGRRSEVAPVAAGRYPHKRPSGGIKYGAIRLRPKA